MYKYFVFISMIIYTYMPNISMLSHDQSKYVPIHDACIRNHCISSIFILPRLSTVYMGTGTYTKHVLVTCTGDLIFGCIYMYMYGCISYTHICISYIWMYLTYIWVFIIYMGVYHMIVYSC